MKTRHLYLKQYQDPNAPIIEEVIYDAGTQQYTRHCVRKKQFVYDVKKIVNTTSPTIGTTLTADDVDGYCKSEDWKVIIK